MRKLLRRYLPDHQAVLSNRWLAPFATTLLHPRLWCLNRRTSAAGFGIGLFCGLIPGPLQMLGAALCCLMLRGNLPLALLTTLYTNPLTIIPLYLLAYRIGARVLGEPVGTLAPPPEFSLVDLYGWMQAMSEWSLGLGKPLGLGLVLLADLLAASGYLLVLLIWRCRVLRAWQRRGQGARSPR